MFWANHKDIALIAFLAALAMACTSGEEKIDGLADTEELGGECVEGEDCNAKPSKPNKPDDDDSADDADDDSETDPLKLVDPLSEVDAISYMKEKCGSCHNSVDGQVRSFWEMDVENFTKDVLATDPMAANVYQTLLTSAKQITAANPSPMPPSAGKLEGKDLKKVRGLVRWIEEDMPIVVTQANQRYGGGSGSSAGGVGVLLNFECDNPVSFRKFMNRVTNDAFNRPPTQDELALTTGEVDGPVTPKDRSAIAKRLFENEEWREEFLEKGLRKFADKMSGSSDINPMDGKVTAEQAADLKEEFYQLILNKFDDASFKDILLTEEIWVSPNTAEYYDGCSAPSSGWKKCDLKNPRSSYFSTMSYLSSKPSSFLVANNNYGRAALMHFLVSGDVFKAAFDEESGEEATNPLPDCLQSNDWRATDNDGNFAPMGAAGIPAAGNLCQSCHIDRQMAAGSILFRPFDAAGVLYNASTNPVEDDPNFAAATVESMVNKVGDEAPTAVDGVFLASLLTSNDEKACVPGAGEGGADLELENVGDLAKYIIGDGRILPAGLARHMPRSMSNILNTSEEIIVEVTKAYESGDGRLAPVFEAYFASETYSCAARGE